jgi:excinuclease UvrABC helicase subunit UvrB
MDKIMDLIADINVKLDEYTKIKVTMGTDLTGEVTKVIYAHKIGSSFNFGDIYTMFKFSNIKELKEGLNKILVDLNGK